MLRSGDQPSTPEKKTSPSPMMTSLPDVPLTDRRAPQVEPPKQIMGGEDDGNWIIPDDVRRFATDLNIPANNIEYIPQTPTKLFPVGLYILADHQGKLSGIIIPRYETLNPQKPYSEMGNPLVIRRWGASVVKIPGIK